MDGTKCWTRMWTASREQDINSEAWLEKNKICRESPIPVCKSSRELFERFARNMHDMYWDSKK